MRQDSESMASVSRLLQTGSRLFSELGPEAVGVRTIVREAGLTLSAVNYYFGGKEELFTETVRNASSELAGQWSDVLSASRAALATPKEVTAWVADVIGRTYTAVTSESAVRQAGLLLVRALLAKNSEAREIALEAVARGQRVVSDTFAQLAPSAPPSQVEKAVMLLLGFFEHGILCPSPSPEASRRAFGAVCLAVSLLGLPEPVRQPEPVAPLAPAQREPQEEERASAEEGDRPEEIPDWF